MKTTDQQLPESICDDGSIAIPDNEDADTILKIIVSRDGKETGRTTGGTRPCPVEGCRGVRIGVRWEDGKLTWPCSAGMTGRGKHLRIR